LAAVAATAGAAIVDGTGGSGPAEVQTQTLSAERAESVRQALADVEHALHVAQRARRIARVGRGKARTALATARSMLDQVERALSDSSTALANSNTALDQSGTALDQAQNANSRLDSTRVRSQSESGSVSTAVETDYVSLGGPSVTVDVPSSGLIEVWATVRFEQDGAVALYEDGQRVPIPGQEGICTGGGPLEDALISAEGLAPITLSSPPSYSDLGLGCGVAGAVPGDILLQRAPGTHTYELRYADVCGCSPAEFSNRTLRVAPRL
jgi:hypothetical protein